VPPDTFYALPTSRGTTFVDTDRPWTEIKEPTMADRKKLLGEFKDFILQGNVISLAVAVIIALYFGPVIKDVVNLILNILAIPGTKGDSFETLAFHIGGGTFAYGNLISDIITFLLVAAVVFFVVVKPIAALVARRQAAGPAPESTTRPCPECLSDIPKAATRCAFCTAPVAPLPVPAA
jgi:large conductance mechanosensitive channel